MSETPMKKQALLIGINQYTNLPELKYARQDAEAFEQTLKQNYSFSNDEVLLLTDVQPEQLKPSNRRIIEQHLEMLAGQDLDLLIIGFWGHSLPRNGQRYLCPIDANSEGIEELGLSFDSLQRLLSNIRAKNIWIILDCCQAIYKRGEEETFTAADSSALENMVSYIVKRRQGAEPGVVPNVVILNSCREGQVSYELDDEKHGIFTKCMLLTLENNFKNSKITIILALIIENVKEAAKKLGKVQEPQCCGNGYVTLPQFKLEAQRAQIYEEVERAYQLAKRQIEQERERELARKQEQKYTGGCAILASIAFVVFLTLLGVSIYVIS